MHLRIKSWPLWRHFAAGFVALGMVQGGTQAYTEYMRSKSAAAQWDWSVPQQWYDAIH
ncbi:hypothetical protein [Nocardia sp. CA-120079]|uniref:hypothetical protein n=1 Tax=Nocardia sp. CA-120079 TaxID=3239974 RepID=UPI003D95B9DA